MAERASRFFRVGDLLALFLRAGCELRTAEATEPGPEGDLYNVRYLISPDRSRYVQLIDLDDSDRLAEAELEQWEDRFGFRIPRP